MQFTRDENRSIVTKFPTIFSWNFSFNDHFKLSLSFLDSSSATLFLLELDAWTHICSTAQNSQNSFRRKCTVSLGAVCLFIQAKVSVLFTLRFIKFSDNVTAYIFTANWAATISSTLVRKYDSFLDQFPPVESFQHAVPPTLWTSIWVYC